MGSAAPRPDGNSAQRQGSTFFQPKARTRIGGGRCASDSMALSHPSLCVPPLALSRQGVKASRIPSGTSDSSCSRVAKKTVVCGPSQSRQGRALTVGPPSEPSSSRTSIFRSSGSLLSGGLAYERRRLRKKGYSEPVISTLLRARRPSTTLAYARVWKAFDSWCATAQVQPCRASIADILTFLQDGLKKGLAYSSLRVQVSALGCLRGKFEGSSLACHPDVARFLRGVRNLRPPLRAPCPSWSLNLVLEGLTVAPFEPLRRASLKDLTLKTVFLVAIASARRVSELQALWCREPFLRISASGVSLCTVPSFLPKVVSAFHVNQSVDLPSFSEKELQSSHGSDLKRLDVRRVLLRYLEVTNDFRRSDHLFVLWQGPKKGLQASKATIARWLTCSIASTYIGCGKSVPDGLKAHSLRSQASSWAESTQVSTQEICRAATWKSLHTFARHYRVDVRGPSAASFGSSVIRAGLSGSHPI
ncbi:heterogeneous nuclear ribonucleoprotein A1 isoform X1 [Rhinatrema bivittatum]|uniref:heterogeneous nuclear ribonucleoprotein A1 isoform X1 n=1 Tax=Rhinatrema bivittatum TaxID=194408 RepID=UPI00112A5DD0|nr:heterogeneous nuclear ribonucleoprotein A1 isoform X1 [Rhinatrema bivittatum]